MSARRGQPVSVSLSASVHRKKDRFRPAAAQQAELLQWNVYSPSARHQGHGEFSANGFAAVAGVALSLNKCRTCPAKDFAVNPVKNNSILQKEDIMSPCVRADLRGNYDTRAADCCSMLCYGAKMQKTCCRSARLSQPIAESRLFDSFRKAVICSDGPRYPVSVGLRRRFGFSTVQLLKFFVFW